MAGLDGMIVVVARGGCLLCLLLCLSQCCARRKTKGVVVRLFWVGVLIYEAISEEERASVNSNCHINKWHERWVHNATTIRFPVDIYICARPGGRPQVQLVSHCIVVSLGRFLA